MVYTFYMMILIHVLIALVSIVQSTVLLFLMWVCWQMVHFYAIAIYREKDYASASIPVLPVKKGIAVTKIQMFFYTVLFVIANSLLTIFHYAGYVYLIGISLLGFFWLCHAIKGLFASDSVKWARKMFFYSLIIMLAMCLLLSVGSILP